MRWWLCAALMLLVAGTARAEPMIRPLFKAGGWTVVTQGPAGKTPADSCLIVEPAAAVAIRSIGHTLDLMMANAHWDLPLAMKGAIRVTVGARTIAFPVTATTANTAAARIDAPAVPILLRAMTSERLMGVMLFPGQRLVVPLQGFATALPVFKRCAGLD